MILHSRWTRRGSANCSRRWRERLHDRRPRGNLPRMNTSARALLPVLSLLVVAAMSTWPQGFDKTGRILYCRLSFNAVAEQFLAEHLGGRAEPVGNDFAGSTIEVRAGADHVKGLAEALKGR